MSLRTWRLGFVDIWLRHKSSPQGQWLLSSTRRQLVLERLMGVVFVGLAARLIMMERKS